MKIVLIGKNGQLGRECLGVLQDRHDLVALGSRELDITDASQVEEMVGRLQPEVVINCAAFTQVDLAEQKRDLAWRLNVLGPQNLAASLKRQGGILLQMSTDYVFDGRKPAPEPYREDDQVAPLSYYGQTKVAAERFVMQEMDRYIIVRTAWLYGRHGRNFLKTILRLALSQPDRPLKVVHDQFGSLTWSFRLAQQLARIVEAGGRGVYHASAQDYGTWFDVASHFLAQMGLATPVIPCTSDQYPTLAQRPRNSILANQRLQTQGLDLMRPWRADLDEFIGAHRGVLLQEAMDQTGRD